MKRIALDISQIHKKGTGIGNYTRYLYNKLAKIEAAIKFIDIPVIESSNIPKKLYVYFWEQIVLPFYLLIKGIGLCHRTANMGIPIIRFSQYIITIHDIIPKLFEDEYLRNPIKRIMYSARMKWTVFAAKKIIADSECTKKDLIKHFNAKDEKIEVIYLGLDKKYRRLDSEDAIDKIKNKYSITKPYILGIGGNEPRKNVISLIKAYQNYKSKYSRDYKLIIVGKPWTGYSEAEISFENTEDIIYTGYVDDEELVGLYNGASLFVFPSLYEGFGLPPLEAMACGTPVIASNNSSIPEITGDAALLVNACDIEQISNAINKVLSDNLLREDFITKGLDRVKLFDWNKTAIQTLNIYKSIL